MYANFSNVARDIFSTIPHGVGVEASFSVGQNVIGWTLSKTTGEMLGEKVIVRQFARRNKGILADNVPVLDNTETENHLEFWKEAEKRKLHYKVHDFFEMWQGSQNLHATQVVSRSQNKQMPTIGYISDTEEIITASWSDFENDIVAALKLSERSRLPPAWSEKDLPRG